MRNFVSSSFLSRAKLGGVGGPIVFLLVAIAAIAAFYFASLSKGSREEYAEAQEIVPDSAEAEKKLSESRAAETQFTNLKKTKSPEKTSIFTKKPLPPTEIISPTPEPPLPTTRNSNKCANTCTIFAQTF